MSYQAPPIMPSPPTLLWILVLHPEFLLTVGQQREGVGTELCPLVLRIELADIAKQLFCLIHQSQVAGERVVITIIIVPQSENSNNHIDEPRLRVDLRKVYSDY